MAKYMSTIESYINGEYVKGRVEAPAFVELPDDVEPSRKFTPLDKAAAEALQKLENADAAREKREAKKIELPKYPEPPKREVKEEINTMSQMAAAQGKNVVGKRPNDKSPV